MSTIIKQTLKNKANDGHSSNSTDKGVLKNDSTLQRKGNKSLKSERISRFLPCHDDDFPVVSYKYNVSFCSLKIILSTSILNNC